MIERTPLQLVAVFAGVVLIVGGLLGFVPGITTHYGAMALAGSGSHARLLAVFQTSVLLNLVHLLSGVGGLVLARTLEGARTFVLACGVGYLVLWLLGLVGGGTWIPVSSADDWLHFVTGIVLIGLGFFAGRRAAVASAAT